MIKFLFSLQVTFLFLFFLTGCTQKSENSNHSEAFTDCYLRFDNNKNGSTDSLLTCLRITDSLNSSISDERLKWLSDHIKGSLYLRFTDYDRSIFYFKAAQNSILQTQKYDSLLAKSEIAIALAYKNLAKYPEAIQSNLNALTIFEKYKSVSSINKAKTNIANIYLLKGEFNEAKRNLKQVINNNYTEETAIPLHALANLYGELGEIDSAILIDNKMISILRHSPNIQAVSPFYNNKALCYLSAGKLDSSYDYLNRSFELDSLKGDNKNMGVNLISMGDVYSQMGDVNKAMTYYNRAYSIFKTYQIKRELRSYYQQMSAIYKQKNDLKPALSYKDSAYTLGKEIDNLSLNSKIELLKIEYETQKKDTLITNQTQKLRTQQFLFFISVLVLLLLILLIYFFFKTKQAKQKYIQQQLINETAFETEQAERERIARDLHDSIGQKLSVVKMQLSMQKADVEVASNLVDETIQDIRSVSHNLLPIDLKKGLTIALEELVYQINFTSASTKIEMTITSEFKALALSQQTTLYIYRIVQEIINNSLKYAQAKNIHINMDYKKNQILLLLSDDGIGFNMNDAIKSEGIGLKNIKNRVEQLKGTIEIGSSQNKGTIFTIRIPQ